MDTLPGDVAIGYPSAEGLRTNVLHLPVPAAALPCSVEFVVTLGKPDGLGRVGAAFGLDFR